MSFRIYPDDDICLLYIYKIEIMSVSSSPRITVLMAIYNCAPTLVEALDSLMAQTYQRFKVVLCDDCSTDNTYDVARKYIEQYPDKFILIRNDTNRKLPYSLNRCLEYADTEYVARMDGDDISKPERFEKEIAFLDSHPEYALVSCPMEYFDENGVFMVGKDELEPTAKSFLKGSPFSHAAVMMRTENLKSVGAYTVARWTQRGQDVHLWAKFYSRGYIGYNLSDPLYMMRDDAAAYKRRTMKEAFQSVRRSCKIFQLLGISRVRNLFPIIRPIIVCSLPRCIYNYFHKR